MPETLAHGLPTAVLDRIKTVLARHADVQQAVLYGSRAMGKQRSNSDIDLCLIGPELTLSEMLAIETELDDLLLPWKIDLSLHHQIENPALLDHIARVGIAL